MSEPCTVVIFSIARDPIWLPIFPKPLHGALLTYAIALVIVRRVVAARRAHASAMGSGTAQNKNGLFSHGHSASRTQPLTPIGDKEAADMTDFPERPGAKKTKRGGFWARFKCW